MLGECATPSGQKPGVTIVSVNWNGWHDTLECLESIRHLEYPNYLMVVVDNGSQDDSIAQIEAWAQQNARHGYTLVEYSPAAAQAGGEPAAEQSLRMVSPRHRLVLITNRVNSGPTGGANLGIEYALQRKPPADYVFLLDNDARVSRNTLTRLIDVSRTEDAAIVGARILDSKTGRVQLAERTTTTEFFFAPLVRRRLWRPPAGVSSWKTCNTNGGAMLVRKDVLLALAAARGFFLDASLFSDGWEFEVCSYSLQLGYTAVGTRRGFVWHKGDHGYRTRLNPRRFYHSVRNRMLLARSYLPTPSRLAFHVVNVLLCAFRVAKCLAGRRPGAVRAIILGMIDGYREAGKRKAFRRPARESLRAFQGRPA